MSGEGSCKIRRGRRVGVLYEMARLAYSVQQAEKEGHRESGGWYEIRGAFAALLWMNGEWPGALAPDHQGEPDAEHQFQERLHQYMVQFTQADER